MLDINILLNLLVLHNLRDDVCGITIRRPVLPIRHDALRVGNNLLVLVILQSVHLHRVALQDAIWCSDIFIELWGVGLACWHLDMLIQACAYLKGVVVFWSSYCLEELRAEGGFTCSYVLGALDGVHG